MVNMTIKIFYKPGGIPDFYESFGEVVKLKDYHLIRYINCRDSNLISLPEILPMNLRGLYCEKNQITKLPKLPEKLKELRCCFNNLTELPELPLELEELYCSNNQLTQLPDLVYDMFLKYGIYPDKNHQNYKYLEDSRIKKLICNNNQLSSLPKLPDILYHLECKNNKIISLTKLPEYIRNLDISQNKLKKFPKDLHYLQSLMNLICKDNEITQSLPSLPESITRVDISNNPIKYMCDLLPDDLYFLNLSNTQIISIPNIPKNIREIIGSEKLIDYINEK